MVTDLEPDYSNCIMKINDLLKKHQILRDENRKKGISGYSPACGNEWMPGIYHY